MRFQQIAQVGYEASFPALIYIAMCPPVHVSEEAIIDWYVFVPPLLIVFVLPVDEVMLQAGVVGLGARQRGGLHLHHTQGGVVIQNLPTPLLQYRSS